MLTDAIQILAVAFLAFLLVYVVALSFRSVRTGSLVRRGFEAERAVLDARIGEIMDQRRRARETTELSWNGYRKFEIARKVNEGGGICSFYLEPHDGRPLPPFEPGQHLTFSLNVPDHARPVVRCYSLSDGPRPESYRVTIKRAAPPPDAPDAPAGISSSFFHDLLDGGDIVDVKAPSGHFHLDRGKHSPVVLICGGVGITPMLSMLNHIIDAGDNRETWFFYGVRNGGEHIMRDHLARAVRDHENVNLVVCYSDARTDDGEPGEWFHHAGRVDLDLLQDRLPSNNYDFYVCGPPPMMSAIFDDLRGWGVPEARIHYEAFGPATVLKKTESDQSADRAPAAVSQSGDIEIVFDKTGKTCAWDPAAGSLLDFAESQGVVMDFGCRAGSCGTCVTALKSGDVDYLSEPGEVPEKGTFLACVAVPKGPLVVDA